MWNYEIVCGHYDMTIDFKMNLAHYKIYLKKVKINNPKEYANWTQLQLEN